MGKEIEGLKYKVIKGGISGGYKMSDTNETKTDKTKTIIARLNGSLERPHSSTPWVIEPHFYTDREGVAYHNGYYIQSVDGLVCNLDGFDKFIDGDVLRIVASIHACSSIPTSVLEKAGEGSVKELVEASREALSYVDGNPEYENLEKVLSKFTEGR
jgi:hypothetical protein